MADEFSSGTPTISAPPPPPEVKVHTMRSDLESMAKSGGGAPRFENVKVSGLPSESDSFGKPIPKKGIVGGLVVGAIILIVAAVGYLAYTLFLKPAPASIPTSQTPAATTPSAGTTGTTGGSSNSTPVPTPTFTHSSLFKKPADETITVTFSTGGSVNNAADLQTMNQKLIAALATAKRTSTLIEIAPVGSDGHALSIAELLSVAGVQYDAAFLAAHFNADPTVFAYRDKDGFALGAVTSLKAGENWLFLKNDVARLEASPSITTFFLSNVGAASPAGFVDSTIASTTVRTLPFVGPPARSFSYGWTGSTLILSTSPDGFAAALRHL